MSYGHTENKSSRQRNLLLSSLSKKKIKVIGLTGVMGAGKSSVMQILEDFNIPVIDCDQLNEQLQQPDEAGYHAIIEAFGSDICNAEQHIDKAKLSQMIFHDKEKKQKLESIMHPLIKQQIQAIIQSCQQPMIVVEVPLLFEIHWESCFDEIWVVACDFDVLIERLISQRRIAKEEAVLRLSHQWNQDEKIKNADHVLYNNASRDDLRNQIIAILEKEQLYAKK